MPRMAVPFSTLILLALMTAACGPTNVTEQPTDEYPTPPYSTDVDLTISGKVDGSSVDGSFSEKAKRLRAYMYSSEAASSGTFGNVVEGTFDPQTGEFKVELPASIPDDLLSKDFESLCQEGEAELNISDKNLRVSYFSELNLEDPNDDNGLVLEDEESYFGYIVLSGPTSSLSGTGYWFYSNAKARVTGTCTYSDPWDNKAFNLNLKVGWNYVVAEGSGAGVTTYTSAATFPDAFFWYHILSV